MNAAELKRARELSKHVGSLGFGATKNTPKVRAYLMEAPPPSEEKLRSLIEPLVQTHIAHQPAPTIEVTPEMVKQIIAMMHSLPENDKLEVSKGVRNANAFIFNGSKYQTAEMMHGAGSTTFSYKDNEVVAGSAHSWTLANLPIVGSVQLYGNGQFLTAGGVDYTIAGTAITTVNSFVAGTIIAFYRIL